MTDLIEKLLNEKFSEYQSYHTYTLIILTVLFASFQVWQTYRFNKKISAFNSELKKAEIKFSRHHNDQIEAFKTLYERIYEFRSSTSALLYFDNKSATLDTYKLKLASWRSEYSKLFQYFNRNRILFSEETCKLMDESLKYFGWFSLSVSKAKEEIEDFSEHHYDDPTLMYEDQFAEIADIQKRARKLRESDRYQAAGKVMNNLKEELEMEYRNLVN